MIEVFYEQTVSPKDGAKAQSGFKKMKILSWFTLFSAILALIFLYMSFVTLQIPEGGNILTFLLINILPLLIITIGLFVLYGVFRSKKHNYLVDYDYTFVSGDIRIAKVINGLKRKPVARINCSDISAVGKISNKDKFIRYSSKPGVKKIIATPNPDNEETVYYASCTYKGQPSIMLFEPKPEFLINIRKFASRTIEWN